MKYFAPFFLLLIVGCSSPEKWDVEKATAVIFAPDELQFRKFEIGMSRVDFDGAYTGNAIYGNALEVIDSVTVSEGVYCETAFRFDKDGLLSEIAVQLVIDDEEKKNELFQSIRTKLAGDYGKGIEERGQLYWKAEGGIITTDIFLTDISASGVGKSGSRFVISLYYTAGTMPA